MAQALKAPEGDSSGADYFRKVEVARRTDYAVFRALWHAAGKRNAERRSYTEDHGEGWWVSDEEADALRIALAKRGGDWLVTDVSPLNSR